MRFSLKRSRILARLCAFVTEPFIVQHSLCASLGLFSPALASTEVTNDNILKIEILNLFNFISGFVSGILSWKLFMPLGRLCYAAYLINFNLIKVYSSSMRTPIFFNEFEMYLTYFGIVIAVFLISFVASLTVEMPFLSLDKLLFRRDRLKTPKVSATFYFLFTISNFCFFFLMVNVNIGSLTTIEMQSGTVSLLNFSCFPS